MGRGREEPAPAQPEWETGHYFIIRGGRDAGPRSVSKQVRTPDSVFIRRAAAASSNEPHNTGGSGAERIWISNELQLHGA